MKLALRDKFWEKIAHRYRKILKSPHLPLGLFFVGLLILFSFISVNKLDLVKGNQNIFFSYYLSQFDFFKKGWPIILFILMGLIFFANRNLGKGIRRINKRKITRLVALNSFIIFLSFNLALIVVFLFALIQVNILALEIRVSPKSANITWDTKSITVNLKNSDRPPKVIETNYENLNKIILGLEISKNSGGNFYTQRIINNLPPLFVFPVNVPKQNMIMVDNSLIVSGLNKDDLQEISPTLGYLFVRDYFSPRYIKNFPSLRVLGRQDYLKVRDDQINSQVDSIDKLISFVQTYVNNAYTSVSNDKYKISVNQNGLNSSIAERDSDYGNCISAGYYSYYLGAFFHYYTQAYCDSSRSSWDSIISGFQKNVNDWQEQLYVDQGYLNEDLSIKSSLEDFKTLIASQKDETPQELGVFHDNNKIDIAFDWTNSKSSTLYFETLVHEYLHYASFVSTDKRLPTAFEEGLTEYFSRKIIKKELGQETNFGYPLLEKIMNQLFSKLPKDQLEDVYFTKDESTLSYLVDKEYGDKFYENNQLVLSTLPYLSEDKALKTANDFMAKIGGGKISHQDLFSEPVNKSL